MHAWPWHIGRMLQAADSFPMNLAFAGKGNASLPEGLVEQMLAPVRSSFMRTGTTPAAIDNCLNVAEDMDIQVMIHTDTLNESGFVRILLLQSKTEQYMHFIPNAGGGPDIIRV